MTPTSLPLKKCTACKEEKVAALHFTPQCKNTCRECQKKRRVESPAEHLKMHKDPKMSWNGRLNRRKRVVSL